MWTRRNPTIPTTDLQELLAAGQQERVAFLSGKASARQIAETLTALANASGGTVVLGVTAKGTPQKSVAVEPLRERAVEAGLLADPPLILPAPQVVETARGPVVVVQVPPGLPHVYSLQGLYLTRTGPHNRPLTTPELRRLLFERTDAGFERLPVPVATLDDLDLAQVERYLRHIHAPPDEEPVQALLARGCVTWPDEPRQDGSQEVVPTVAGVLLFGRDPQRFFPNAEIICVRYSGEKMSDEFVRQDVQGSLVEQIRQAEAFVVSNMRRGMRLSGMAREESSEYPIPVVREAIVNAIAHRDYAIRGEGIRLLMFSDRLEIYSPGRLPGHVTLENILEERYSRNEAIVAILSDLGYIERLGYGIDRMIDAMAAAGLPQPEFQETAAGFRVILRSAGESLVSPRPESQPWKHMFLNPRQEQALAYVQMHGRITNSEYQRLVPDVSPETIRRDLADLVAKNLLLRIGEKRATYYILK